MKKLSGTEKQIKYAEILKNQAIEVFEGFIAQENAVLDNQKTTDFWKKRKIFSQIMVKKFESIINDIDGASEAGALIDFCKFVVNERFTDALIECEMRSHTNRELIPVVAETVNYPYRYYMNVGKSDLPYSEGVA